jgi:hypothetical protein
MAVSTEPSIFFSKRELNQISRVFRKMDDIARDDAKRKIQELVGKQLTAIRALAAGRGKVAQRIADGGQIKKSSLQGELKFGFASQKFSGGATTQFNTRNDPPGNRPGIGGGYEFGSKRFPNMPRWSGPMPKGPGSKGWFIYPAIRASQPEIIKEFDEIITSIVKEWSFGSE